MPTQSNTAPGHSSIHVWRLFGHPKHCRKPCFPLQIMLEMVGRACCSVGAHKRGFPSREVEHKCTVPFVWQLLAQMLTLAGRPVALLDPLFCQPQPRCRTAADCRPHQNVFPLTSYRNAARCDGRQARVHDAQQPSLNAEGSLFLECGVETGRKETHDLAMTQP